MANFVSTENNNNTEHALLPKLCLVLIAFKVNNFPNLFLGNIQLNAKLIYIDNNSNKSNKINVKYNLLICE